MPMPSSPTITAEVRVETGSKYESKDEAGLSHFLEHMCFKGTLKRPSALAVNQELDELGAISNAFTSTEMTGYWAKAGYNYLPAILDIVSDIYLHAIFKSVDLEKEKGVIIEEINMYEDQPQAMVGELFDEAMHGKQPAGLPVLGNKKSVRSFSVEDFEAYRKKHYVAKATTVIVAGRFDEKTTLSQLKKLFGDISHSKKEDKKPTKIAHEGARVVTKYKDTDQLHLVLGLRAFPYKDERWPTLAVLRGVLSGGMSSRLFQKMREELGICYYVRAISSASTDHGEFAVVSGVDPKRVDEAVVAIVQEFKKLKTDLVSEAELKKVKASLISKMNMALETSDAVADYFADRAIFNHDLRTPKEREERLLKVTAEEVRKVAREIFTDKDLILAIVGKQVNKAKLKKLLTLS